MTLEGSPEIAKLAIETLTGMDLDSSSEIVGLFQQTLDEALSSMESIDYFFNDGHHAHDAVLHYFGQALPYLTENAVMVIDGISWSPGIRRG